MIKYESIIILNPNLNEKEIDILTTKITMLITDEGTIDSIQNYGKKKLAYEVKGNKEGIYIIFYFNSNSKTAEKIEEYYKTEEKILKSLTLRSGE